MKHALITAAFTLAIVAIVAALTGHNTGWLAAVLLSITCTGAANG